MFTSACVNLHLSRIHNYNYTDDTLEDYMVPQIKKSMRFHSIEYSKPLIIVK